jgi:uncharacterized membrane protein
MPIGMIMEEEAFYGPLLALVIFVVLVTLIVYLVKWIHKRRMGEDELLGLSLEQLKEKLANGEIDTREFKNYRNRLRG